MNRSMRSLFLGCTFAIGLMLSACSSEQKLNSVSGKVLVGDKPANGAMIAFHPEGQSGMNVVPSTGVVKDDGTFTLDTNGKPGVPAGNYIVTIIWTEASASKKKLPEGMIGTMSGEDGEGAKDRLGGRFATREASTLRAEVKDGDNVIPPFQIK